ncbi:MAG: hypothetical protein EOO29_04095 [Comamonadaceae bacterium]|nr:MAG: hypothetical protein EOO29_04095 [Comamonadaceae bacterium]
MLDLSALKQIRPFIATPSYSGALTSMYVRSLLGLVNLAWAHGMTLQTRFLDGDSLVTRARNRLAAEFMADERWTHLFWIDADIGFEPEAALRLLLSGRDVAAGAYPIKRDGWPAQGLAKALPAGSTRSDFDALHTQYAFNPRRRADGSIAPVDDDGFIEALDAPTGFMVIGRRVFERLAAAMPELRYIPDGTAPGHEQLVHYRFFDTLFERDTGRWLSEDYAFCRRWQALGGRVHVDARSCLAHQGLQTWQGDLGRQQR